MTTETRRRLNAAAREERLVQSLRRRYSGYEKVSPLVTQLPWTHNLIVMGQSKRHEGTRVSTCAWPCGSGPVFGGASSDGHSREVQGMSGVTKSSLI